MLPNQVYKGINVFDLETYKQNVYKKFTGEQINNEKREFLKTIMEVLDINEQDYFEDEYEMYIKDEFIVIRTFKYLKESKNDSQYIGNTHIWVDGVGLFDKLGNCPIKSPIVGVSKEHLDTLLNTLTLLHNTYIQMRNCYSKNYYED